MSDYITTYTKIHMNPLNPKSEDIKIVDIAHALSNLCRANGHIKHFYSVAQHSINCAHEAQARGWGKRIQLACLLHDASEAYLSDITRPVKHHLTQYLEIEKNLQDKIYDAFNLNGLTQEELIQVSEIDDAMLYYEFIVLMDDRVFDSEPALKSKPDFELRAFSQIETEFLNLFQRLTDEHYKPQKGHYVGIDGAKGGWVAVCIHENGFEVTKYKTLSDVCQEYPSPDSMIIDMPLGLPESENDIRPDNELRKRLKGKASSVFPIPCRQAVYAIDYQTANAINKSILGKGLTKQSFEICNKIHETDEYLTENKSWQNKLKESHPEFCFAQLNGGTPILANKKTPEGEAARINLLQKFYEKSYDVYRYAKNNADIKNSIDDVLDALCLAVTGLLGCQNGFVTIPECPSCDSKELKMQIVYAKISLN